jgi:hypothetical protein
LARHFIDDAFQPGFHPCIGGGFSERLFGQRSMMFDGLDAHLKSSFRA